MRWPVTLLLLASACANNGPAKAADPSPSPSPIAAPAEAPPPLAFLALCRDACSQRNAKRAIAASMIDAECRDGCLEAWSLPAVRNKADLGPHAGQQVRAFGQVNGSALNLADGTTLPLAGPASLEGLGTGEMVVVGTVDGDGLTHVTVVAPSGR